VSRFAHWLDRRKNVHYLIISPRRVEHFSTAPPGCVLNRAFDGADCAGSMKAGFVLRAASAGPVSSRRSWPELLWVIAAALHDRPRSTSARHRRVPSRARYGIVLTALKTNDGRDPSACWVGVS
jgi:hypothetical protein